MLVDHVPNTSRNCVLAPTKAPIKVDYWHIFEVHLQSECVFMHCLKKRKTLYFNKINDKELI